MKASLTLPTLGILLAGHTAAAQPLAPGSLVRVRLAQPSEEIVEGVLDGITVDSIFIRQSADRTARFPRGSVLTLFEGFREQRESSTAISALAGAPLGMLVGALVGSATAKPGVGHRTAGGALGAVAGLVIGATVGGSLGHAKPGISWFEVPWPTEARNDHQSGAS